MLVVVLTLVQTHTFNQWMISLANFSLLWFGKSASLPPRCEKASLMVLDERLTSFINMDYSQIDNDMMYIESWQLRKYSDRFFWRQTFQAAIFFAVSFLPLSLISFSQPPVYILLLYQCWGISVNSNQVTFWWLHHFLIAGVACLLV